MKIAFCLVESILAVAGLGVYGAGANELTAKPGCMEGACIGSAVDDGGNEIPGTYDLTFSSGMTTTTLVISEMDGTTDTLAGLDLNAMVTTEDENPAGVRWCDFYDKAEPVILRVYDVPPVILCPEGQEFEVTYSNMTTYAIHYGCTDVAADLEAGVRVEIRALQRFVKNPFGILASLRARDSLQFNQLMRLCKRNPTFL